MKTTTCLMTLLTIATLKIGQYLKFPWSLLSYMGFMVPKFLRDLSTVHLINSCHCEPPLLLFGGAAIFF